MYQNQILSEVRKSGGVTNYELSKIALQYNYEIFKLRKQGHNIKKRRVYQGTRATNTYVYYIDDVEPLQPLRVDPSPLVEGKAVHVNLSMKERK